MTGKKGIIIPTGWYIRIRAVELGTPLLSRRVLGCPSADDEHGVMRTPEGHRNPSKNSGGTLKHLKSGEYLYLGMSMADTSPMFTSKETGVRTGSGLYTRRMMGAIDGPNLMRSSKQALSGCRILNHSARYGPVIPTVDVSRPGVLPSMKRQVCEMSLVGERIRLEFTKYRALSQSAFTKLSPFPLASTFFKHHRRNLTTQKLELSTGTCRSRLTAHFLPCPSFLSSRRRSREN